MSDRFFTVAEIKAWKRREDGWYESPDGHCVFINDLARVHDLASVGAWASVGDKQEFKTSPIYIIGTRHVIFQPAPGRLCIGCINLPLDDWLEKADKLGAKQGYTPTQIAEYKLHIQHAIALENLKAKA